MEDMQTAPKEEEQKESSAQEKINLRREARRRKILENAKTRLDRLGRGSGTGDSQQTIGAKVETNCEYSDPEVEPDIVHPERIQQTQMPAFNPADLFSSLNTETVGPAQQKGHFLLKSRVHILLAAAIAYLIAMIDNDGTVGYSVFVPAGIFIALELTYFREPKQINPITSLVITMCGVKSQRANRLWQVLSTIHGLIVDIGILVFFFCTLTFLLTMTSDRFVNLVKIK